MTIANKFIVSLMLSIFFIATINIVAFYVFYTSYLKVYFADKISSREKITVEYINNIIEQQTLDDISSIFSDTEIEIYEQFELNNWELEPNEVNSNLVIDLLRKYWVWSILIEQIIPTDNFWKVLDAIKDKNSPEYKFINNLTISIILTNIFAISVIILAIIVFVKKTISPIQNVTESIRLSKPWSNFNKIEYYNKNDEIWLLITAINNLNSKLDLQEKIRWRLLADISHELKTPITSIQCYLEWISDWVIKLNQKNLNSITDEMKRLILMVNKIMDYEKLEREKLELELTDVNIYDLITQVVETHKKRLKENKQRIKVNWDINQIIQSDSSLVTQLIHNLIGNFLKYSGNKTLLRINITKSYIDFSDDGKWIKSSEVSFLTEKFYQGNIEKSWDIEARWIWVWLSITKKIIDSHNWRFEIKSDTWKWFSFKIII